MEKTTENRLSLLRQSLAEKKFDTLMVLIEENRHYLSGFTGEDTQFDESAGALFITDSKLILATDSRYELQAKNEAPLFKIVCYKEGLAKELPNITDMLGTKRLGFESVRMSYMQYNKMTEELNKAGMQVELVPVEDMVENLRLIKDESEINTLKKALLVAEAVFKHIKSTIELGMTEKQLAWSMEKEMREAGAQSLSFPTIVASGPNSALPHAIPSDRKIRSGEPVLFDWGAKLDGYCSDISRTVIVGTPDETFKKVFTTVSDAQKMATDAVKPGISSKAVDKIARDHIEKCGFKGKFGHGLGHGTGLAVHEHPRLSPLKETALESGMVFTVEPGIYIQDWGGIRLENMVAVRDSGVEVLNQLDPADFLIEI
ncbi:MAG: Xaa-Pro peptidase family protein [Thermodesulfobacteriota bacterium]|nr:Xaa-Pro peptidase family protein [Thermodesulfobacteriota bacterium]